MLFQGCVFSEQVAVQGNAFADHQYISEELRAGGRAAEFRVVFDASLESYWTRWRCRDGRCNAEATEKPLEQWLQPGLMKKHFIQPP